MLIYTHDACLLHDTGPDHPECSARLQVVLDVLRRDHGDLEWREAPLAHLGDLKRVHAQPHIVNVLEADFDGFRMLESDTVVVAASRAAALRAAGAGIAAVDALMAGEDITAFCAVRPPGHHATPDAAMGFCLLNNIAVAASHALATHALERVAIVDFDAHHGNGTQAIFWGEPRVGYFSSHEGGQFPYTGQPGERGCGNIRNVTLKANSGSASFRDAWIGELLPALDAFRPQLLLLSAGFDAHRCDPMADLMAETADFAWLTAELRALAEKHAGGRVVSMLEGGYDLDALRECVAVHVAALR